MNILLKALIFFLLIFLVSFNLYSADCKKTEMPNDQEWQIWLQNIKLEALEEGISQKIIEIKSLII